MWSLKFFQKHISQDTLSEYLDGRLSGGTLARVRRELDACAVCREELEGLRGAAALMRALPMETPARSFVMSAPPLPEPATTRRSFTLRAPSWAYAGAASVAVLALAALISIDALGQSGGDSLDFAAAPAANRVATTANGESSVAIQAADTERKPGVEDPSAFSAASAPSATDQDGANPPVAAQAPSEATPTAAARAEATAPQALAGAGEATGPAGGAAATQGEDLDETRASGGQALAQATPQAVPEQGARGVTDDAPMADKASEAVEPTPAPAPARPPDEIPLPQNGGFPWLRVLESVAGAAVVLSLAAWLLAHMTSRRRI